MSNAIVLAFATLCLLLGAIKRVPLYDTFVAGAKKGLQTAAKILPNLAAMLIAISLLKASGLMDAVQNLLSPLLDSMGIPNGAAPLMLMRPFSGSGSLAMLKNIMNSYGPDSRTGLIACTLMGSSETIFYTLGIYMAAGKINRCRYALAAALIAWLTAAWVAGQFYR